MSVAGMSQGDDKDIWLTAQVKIDLTGKGKTFAGQAAHGPCCHGLQTNTASAPFVRKDREPWSS